MEYNQRKDFMLMTWETDPVKRNINNVVTANVHKSIELLIGDKLKTSVVDNKISTYTIVEILDKKQSTMQDFNNYKLVTKWGYE